MPAYSKNPAVKKKQKLSRRKKPLILTEEEIEAYFKAVPYVLKKDTILVEHLIKKTNFLTPFNPSLPDRLFHFKKNLNFPLVGPTGKLATAPVKKKVDFIIKLARDFVLDKKLFLKNWLNLKNKERLSQTFLIKFCFPITTWLKEQALKIDKDLTNCNLIQIAYHLHNNMLTMPKCAVCNKQIKAKQFNQHLFRYPITCSHKCNNVFRDNIEKRLTKNFLNSNGYKTNVGKNEQLIFDCLKQKFKTSFEPQQQIGSYIVDGFSKTTNTIIEIQEKHHSYTKQQVKDIKKIQYFSDKGYRIIIVFDNWFQSKTKKSKRQASYVKEISKIKNTELIFFTTVDGEVFTKNGWSKFVGIKKTNQTKTNWVTLTTSSGKCITITEDHKIFTNSVDYKFAKDFQKGDTINTIDGLEKIKNIKTFNTADSNVYDVINTFDHTVFVDNILTHQCLCIDEAAFIEPHILEEFWASVIPAISSGKTSKIFMVSTPNGVGNKFYEIYSESVSSPNTRWKSERIDWGDVPERDENWKKDMIAALGSEEKFLQEFANVFIDNASSAVGAAVIERFKQEKKPPIWIGDNGDYEVYEYPESTNLYAIGVDVGEGIGRAASVAQVLDITDLKNIKQVAVYGSTTIEPYHFANKLNTIGHSWGVAPMLIERNNCGAQVIDALYYQHNYEKIVSYNKISEKDQYNRTRNLGVLSHTNIKFDGIQNMRYWVNHLQTVAINDSKTILEFETFIRHPNGVYRKRNDNYFDDRIMSLVWALFLLEPSLCQQYFTIEEFDSQLKPLKISSNGYWEQQELDYFLKELNNEQTVIPNYNSNQTTQTSSIKEYFEVVDKYDEDIDSLFEQGYQFL